MSINKRVGGRIRELRRAQGLTQVELSGRTGMTQASISHLENGKYSPTIDALSRVADALGVSLAEAVAVGQPCHQAAPRAEDGDRATPFLAVPEARWVASNDVAFAIRDALPVSPGHSLVVLRRRASSWFDATREEQVAMLDLVDQVKAGLDATHEPDGYSIGIDTGVAVGQAVSHVCVHVIPRYASDMGDPRGGDR